MTLRSLLAASVLAAVASMGCSSPDAEPMDAVASTSSADTIGCDGSSDLDDESVECETGGRKAFTIVSFDGTYVTGVNGFGQTIHASFAPSTAFRKANLSRFIPGEPIRPALVAYNAAIASHADLGGALETLLAFGGHARIRIKANAPTVIKAFRPVP